MKSISASIVICAGLFAIGRALPMLSDIHPIFVLILLAAGIITLALGLVGWWASLKYDR